MPVLWNVIHVGELKLLLDRIFGQAIEWWHLNRRKRIDEIKQLHEFARLPLLNRWEKHRHVCILHVSVLVVLLHCLDNVGFRLWVDTDVVHIIVLAYLLVPKVQSKNPIGTDPACVILLHRVQIPATTFRHQLLVSKNSGDGQVLDISFEIVMFVDKRLQTARIAIPVQFLVLPVPIVLQLVVSDCQRSWRKILLFFSRDEFKLFALNFDF